MSKIEDTENEDYNLSCNGIAEIPRTKEDPVITSSQHNQISKSKTSVNWIMEIRRISFKE